MGGFKIMEAMGSEWLEPGVPLFLSASAVITACPQPVTYRRTTVVHMVCSSFLSTVERAVGDVVAVTVCG